MGRALSLAGELLSAAGTEQALVELQREELVPLELDLLAVGSPTPATPGELVSLVRPPLSRARRRQAQSSNERTRPPDHELLRRRSVSGSGTAV